MTNEEHHLLKENKGCFKCHKPFASHLACDGICDFPSPTNYTPVSQSLITSLKEAHQAKRPVAAVTSSHAESSTSVFTPDDTLHPVAVLMPSVPNPVAYHATNESSVLKEGDSSETVEVSARSSPPRP